MALWRRFCSLFHFFVTWLVLIALVVISRRPQTLEGEPFFRNHICLLMRTSSLTADQLWFDFPNIVNQCSVRSELNIAPFDNADETKYFILPRKEEEECTVISLGVGQDVEAERRLKEAVPYCSFHGADPVKHINSDLYSTVGKFHHVAVGDSNGTMDAMVLEDSYVSKKVAFVDIATFFRNYVKKPLIDNMFMDVEWAEYGMLPFLHVDGQLAKEGVTICQLNVEVHRPDSKQKKLFSDFFRSMLERNEYTPLVSSTVIGHVRIYLVNHKDPSCYSRFIAPQSS